VSRDESHTPTAERENERERPNNAKRDADDARKNDKTKKAKKKESRKRTSTSSRLLIPSFLSISYSTGRPWQSHPKRRETWWPVTEA